jgi:hypothetical protein
MFFSDFLIGETGNPLTLGLIRCLFIYGFCDDAVGNYLYGVKWYDDIEWLIGNDFEWSGRGLFWNTIAGIRLEGRRRITKTLE